MYTFLIGAGASVPYGYPTGFGMVKKSNAIYSELIRTRAWEFREVDLKKRLSIVDGGVLQKEVDLLKSLNGISNESAQLLVNLHLVKSLIYEDASVNICIVKRFIHFLKDLIDSRSYTIDRFTIQKKCDQYTRFSKFLICHYLYDSEFKNYVQEYDWIEHIINKFSVQKGNYSYFNKRLFPRVYSFNYDRKLETTIIDHLMTFHDLKFEDALKIVNELDIVHIYGTYRNLENPLEDTFEDCFKHSLTYINFLGEGESSFGEESFFNDYMKSERLYIIGFGYDSLNFEKVFKRFARKKKATLNQLGAYTTEIYSTNIGLKGTSVAQDYYNVLPKVINGLRDKNIIDIDCKFLIENHKPM